MFQLRDTFRTFDENKQPYTFRVERHTETDNLHAGVTGEGFSLKSVGNRHILNTPRFRCGVFQMNFRVTCLEEVSPEFLVFFRYREESRKGLGIRIRCGLDGLLEMMHVSVEGSRVQVQKTQSFSGFFLSEERFYTMTMTVTDKEVSCRLDTCEAIFTLKEAEEVKSEEETGRIAIERSNFIGELILKQVHFFSEEDFASRILIPKTMSEIPCINGGDIPYTFTWELVKIQEEAYLRCALGGGTKTRLLHKEDRMGQYVAETDWMENPYIGIYSDGKEQRYQLSEGSNCFVDPNIFWECQKGFWNDTELPLEACYRIREVAVDENTEIIFGYEKLLCRGYRCQCGGSEFRFTARGRLVYSGPALDGRDIENVYSPMDKLAVSLIPEDCYKREEVVEHFQYNHYFEVSEKPTFTLEYCTVKDPEYMTLKGVLLDVYETRVFAESVGEEKKELWKNGYTKLSMQVAFEPLPVGVYKIRLEVFYGEKQYRQVTHVFEVFDRASDANPALATGLPFVFSMPNEQKWLERNSFDAWNPARSCDVEHFITCVTDTPIEAKRRHTWELSKPFKREWFAWLGARTCNDFLADHHKDIIKHADYLFYGMDSGVTDWLGAGSLFPLRPDHWVASRLKNPLQQELLEEFAGDYPESKEFACEERFGEFMERYHEPWIKLVNERVVALLEQQNRELVRENPDVRRAIYGPVNIYCMPTATAATIPFFGLPRDERLSEIVYTGFAIFEDYPYSCAYQTYRGPFVVMTTLLYAPKLVIYPEQYQAGFGGCIDGAVKFAHAPMGAYGLEPYQNSTQAFEYVYNTAYRTKEGYHYWDTYGFHRPDYQSAFMDQLVLDWGHVVKSKPAEPLKALAFLAEYASCDNRVRSFDCGEGRVQYTLTNQSETGSCLIHECSRAAGVPNGFALRFDTLETLSAEECDLLVVPSLKEATSEQIGEIRRLYEEGVNLIAVSDVTGLEDLFGVEKAPCKAMVNSVSWYPEGQEEAQQESVYGMEASFAYAPCGAEVIMTANDGLAALLRTGRTALVNTDVTCLGSEDMRKVNTSNANHIVGTVIRKALASEIARLSAPLVQGENVGVTLYETTDGRIEVLAIDYTPYDNKEYRTKEGVVKLKLDGVTDVKCEREIYVGRKNGMMKEVRFAIRPHEAVFLELEMESGMRER